MVIILIIKKVTINIFFYYLIKIGVTQAVPIFEGYSLPHAISKNEIVKNYFSLKLFLFSIIFKYFTNNYYISYFSYFEGRKRFDRLFKAFTE